LADGGQAGGAFRLRPQKANLKLGQLIDIIETVYRGASKGRGLVVSPKGAS
jgi:hypothetical protein